MTARISSVLSDARNIAAVLMLAGAAAGGLWAVTSWCGTRVSSTEAGEAHDRIRAEYRNADAIIEARAEEIEAKTDAATVQFREVGRDVKTIKCLMLSPNVKAKSRCGLE